MREDLIKQLRWELKRGDLTKEEAQDVIDLYDEECEDTSEFTAWDKAMFDIEDFRDNKKNQKNTLRTEHR